MDDPQALRALIRSKLMTGDLPRPGAPTAFGSPANGETCDGCAAVIPRGRLVAQLGDSGNGLQFHILCFVLWSDERWRVPVDLTEPRSLF